MTSLRLLWLIRVRILICLVENWKGLPLYSFRYRSNEDSSLELGDLTENIFLNAKAAEKAQNVELSAFLSYVNGNAAKSAFTQAVDREAERVKNNKGDTFMPQIIPIRDLKNTVKMSELCHGSDEPIFITKNGYGDMVLMSMEHFESLNNKWGLYNEIEISEAQIRQGKIKNARSALKDVKEKYGL